MTMNRDTQDRPPEKIPSKGYDEYRALFDEILDMAAGGQITFSILSDISALLKSFFSCETVEILFREKRKIIHIRNEQQIPVLSSAYDQKTDVIDLLELSVSATREQLAWIKKRILQDNRKTSEQRLVWQFEGVPDTDAEAGQMARRCARHTCLFIPSEKVLSGFILIRFACGLRYEDVPLAFLNRLVSIIGLSLRHNRSHFELRERVKEMTCMYNIANLSAASHQGVDDFLQQAVELLPAAYLYPDITEAQIVLDGRVYQTCGYMDSEQYQCAEIGMGDGRRGRVKVIYRGQKPGLDEGPFLTEERHLLDSFTAEITTIIKRREAEEERIRLQQQLRHADRLATIGKLAAGVAHELNEPLTGILGFAELLKEIPQMPDQALIDIARIESASLHAREVVRTLLTFARQLPPKQDVVDLNHVIREVASFLEGRIIKQNTRLEIDLDEELPEIYADESQIRQVVLNLMVNAFQAVEGDGAIRVISLGHQNEVRMVFRDSGSGISDEIKDKIFLPFFTTKAVNKGTGMGLSVVHGIVKSHLGRIEVTSKPGKGSTFSVYLPIGSGD